MSQKPQQTGTSDVIKVRYEKLNALKEAGRDPFVITTSARDVLTETIKTILKSTKTKMYALQAVCFQKEARARFRLWTFGIVRAKSRFLQNLTISVKKNTVSLKSGISVISLK